MYLRPAIQTLTKMERTNPISNPVSTKIPLFPSLTTIHRRNIVLSDMALIAKRGLMVLILLAIFSSFVQGAARVASVSGNWSNPATWGGNPVPVLADDVTINTGIVVTVDMAAQCNTLTINGGNNANGGITISGTNSLDRKSVV